MRISVAADERTGVADAIVEDLRRRGHEPIPHGALNEEERDDWAWASEAAARDVAEGRAEQGIVCCWTGTGASIAANKVPGIRAALCADAPTAEGARRWNDANVLALSLRATSEVDLAYADRPYVVLNFATTLDGRAAIEGRSGAIGSDTDTEMLQLLRTRVDAVMIGAGTMRAERYGRMVSDPEFRAFRERTGLAHDPLAV